MTPTKLEAALGRLGSIWELGRPATQLELAKALRIEGVHPGRTVYRWLTAEYAIPGPVAVAVELMLSGAVTPHISAVVKEAKENPLNPGALAAMKAHRRARKAG